MDAVCDFYPPIYKRYLGIKLTACFSCSWLYLMIENWTKREFIIQRLLAITFLVVLIVLFSSHLQFLLYQRCGPRYGNVTFPIYNFSISAL